MAAYPPKDLDALWRQNRLTTEQAVGHLVQLMLELAKRLDELERRLRHLEQRATP